MDGQVTTVPVYIQPDSEQECSLGFNTLPALGISVIGEPLIGSPGKAKPEAESTNVNLLQTTILPGLNACLARTV